MNSFYCSVIGLVLFALIGVDGLYCFKCLNIDCSGSEEDMECQRIRAFIQSELKPLYYFGHYLDPCPQQNDTYNWRIMQVTDENCPAEKANEATCTLGRMQIKTTETNPDGKTKVRIHHATIMGCATRRLLHRIREAYEHAGQCDLIFTNQTGVGVVRELQIEHCRDISKQCFEKDYCIDWKQSVIKPWADQKKNGKFDNTLKIGIFAIVVVVIFALLIAGLCRDPTGRIANLGLPKAIGDDSEMVKVLQIKDTDLDKSRLTSIEVDQQSINGNGTLGKRPNVPPPPPPRLHRPVARESTPV